MAMKSRKPFDFERLNVYHAAVKFYDLARRIIRSLPKDYIYESDELRRAALSVLLNLCEGIGEFSKPERCRFFRMSLRSASECAALIRLLVHDLGERSDLIAAENMLQEIIAMLIGLIKHNTTKPKTRAKPA